MFDSYNHHILVFHIMLHCKLVFTDGFLLLLCICFTIWSYKTSCVICMKTWPSCMFLTRSNGRTDNNWLYSQHNLQHKSRACSSCQSYLQMESQISIAKGAGPSIVSVRLFPPVRPVGGGGVSNKDESEEEGKRSKTGVKQKDWTRSTLSRLRRNDIYLSH